MWTWLVSLLQRFDRWFHRERLLPNTRRRSNLHSRYR
jgi:hypothetical protein